MSAQFGAGGVFELDLGDREIPSIVEGCGQLYRGRVTFPTRMRKVSSHTLLKLLIQVSNRWQSQIQSFINKAKSHM